MASVEDLALVEAANKAEAGALRKSGISHKITHRILA